MSLRAQADARPEAVAVAHGERRLTFRALTDLADRLAAHLIGLGVQPDQRVGLYVEPSADLLAGAWGTLFAGAAYLPLSPEYPEDRLRYMIEDSATEVIVTQEHLVRRLRDLAPRTTRVVTLSDIPSHAAPAPEPRRDSLAYVIYTSGSTGRPKGVMIEHHSIASQMRWLHAYAGLDERVTVLQKTPMSFDAAQWEILAPALGCRVVMGPPGVYRDPEALIDIIIGQKVTTLQCVPTLLQALVDTERLRECATLTRVFCGGEALSRQLARAFVAEAPWASLVNLYGPTECTINATAFLVAPEAIGEGAGTIPIGVPVDNTHCFILDGDKAPVEIEEVGELYLGGAQLARGYVGRPDLTAERFIASPFVPTQRLYRTGDLAFWNPDGTIQFVGRADNQVKLRGHRVELDEVASAIEEHTWVRRAAAVVVEDPRTKSQNLLACVELNPKEAALMDQGRHASHHQSKASRLQVRAQLSNPGLRPSERLASEPRIALPGRHETPRQRAEVFARKSYRFFEGRALTREDILSVLTPPDAGASRRTVGELRFEELGELLRWFGQFHSDERLLPKYAYASPGALYATQLYLETSGTHGVPAGLYYYHPVEHTLARVGPAEACPPGTLLAHFAGKTSAIEPVYKNNIQEVLEFEAGHMLATFEAALPDYGLAIRPHVRRLSDKARLGLADEDHLVGTFAITAADDATPERPVEVYVQAHGDRVAGLAEGWHRHTGADFERLSDEIVRSKHVIAINQAAYARSSFGVALVSRARAPWLAYVDLGAVLHHLQRNSDGIGFLSSGYSSKTGHPLPAARRIDDILSSCGVSPGPCYFAIGGGVSEEQTRSEGMREDAVHMRGPAEIIRDELTQTLPEYMVPTKVLVVDALPLTANGKVDAKAARAVAEQASRSVERPHVPPSTPTERELARIWGEALGYEQVSAQDEFFACGGNSLTAVALVNRVNRRFGVSLPFQVIFECPTVAELAARVDGGARGGSSRLVLLNSGGARRPIFCWPGLGGYPMNLRPLARRAPGNRPFYGVQAHGVNNGETPYPTIRDMAAADVAQIQRVQPVGPYTLCGYSFGARVAFEAAWQLEQLGAQVDNVVLICPGNPRVESAEADRGSARARTASFADRTYAAILLSVFTGTLRGPEHDRLRARVRDEDEFVAFVHELFPRLDKDVIRNIMTIAATTYEFDYTFHELAQRRLRAPVAVLKAAGDDYSFIEACSGYSADPATVARLAGDHYSVLREPGVAELAAAIGARVAD